MPIIYIHICIFFNQRRCMVFWSTTWKYLLPTPHSFSFALFPDSDKRSRNHTCDNISLQDDVRVS